MNIGSRIVERLNELGWKRKDLLAQVDDLSDQALSNLIRRGSKRSEWDEAIAKALGISVLDLVYGYKSDPAVKEPEAAYDTSSPPNDDESRLLRAYRLADPPLRRALLRQADGILEDLDNPSRLTGGTLPEPG